MDLPEETKLRYLRQELTRGRIFRFRTTLLDDPKTPVREKFAVVVSCAIENDDVMFIYATSRVAEYKASRLAGEVLLCPVGSYPCFGIETAIPVRNVKTVPLSYLAALASPSDFELVGDLTAADVAKLDAIMMKTREIEVRYKQRCLPGAVRG